MEHDGPPLPPDWLGPCDPAAIGPFLADESHGWVEDASCSGGVCIVIGWDCNRAGCVTPCEFDWDCAQGTYCYDMWAFGGEGEDRKLCMPGPPFEGFSCD